MKNIVNWFGIIAIIVLIGLIMTVCKLGEEDVNTTGQMTITGLNTYEGKKITAFAQNVTNTHNLYAGGRVTNFTENGKVETGGYVYPATINSGQAVMKVFIIRDREGQLFYGYTGNHQDVKFDITIGDSDTGGGNIGGSIVYGTVTVSFTDGIASGQFVKINNEE